MSRSVIFSDCVKRNFGNSWSNLIAQKTTWICFLCDMKQIWPHRAITYLLILYYSQLKEENKVESSANVTTCCSPASEQSESGFPPVLTLPDLFSPDPSPSLARIAELVRRHQTQVAAPLIEDLLVSQSANRIGSTALQTTFMGTHSQLFSINEDRSIKNAPKVLPLNQPSSVRRSTAEASFINHNITGLTQPFTVQLAESPAFRVDNMSQAVSTEQNLPTMFPQRLADGNVSYDSSLRGSSSEENANKLPGENVVLENQIINRPMPKSKRDMLLKNLLISSGIDTHDTSIDKMDIDKVGSTSHVTLADGRIVDFSEASVFKIGDEPTAQSIIDSANRRLKSLYIRQGEFNVNDIGAKMECEIKKESSKIRIRKIEELQSSGDGTTFGTKNDSNSVKDYDVCTQFKETPEEVDVSGLKQGIIDASTFGTENDSNSVKDYDVCTQFKETPEEVDVSGLKQGIIDASRILINTQKRFKELAKIVSSSSSFKKAYASKLLKQFEDILYLCRRDMDEVDKSTKTEFTNLRYSNNMDLLLDSIKKAEIEKTNMERAENEKMAKAKKLQQERTYEILRKSHFKKILKDRKEVRQKKAIQVMRKSRVKNMPTDKNGDVLITDVRSLVNSTEESLTSVNNSFQPQNNTFPFKIENERQIEAENCGKLEDSLGTLVSIYDSDSKEEASKGKIKFPKTRIIYKVQNESRNDLEKSPLVFNQRCRKAITVWNVNRKNDTGVVVPCKRKKKPGRQPGSKNKNPGKRKIKLINCNLDSDDSNDVGRRSCTSIKIENDLPDSDDSSLVSSKVSPERKRLYRRTKMSRPPLRLTRKNLDNSSLAYSTLVNTVNITDKTVVPFPINFILRPCSIALERLSVGSEQL